MWKWEAEKPKAVFVIVHGAGEYHVRYQWLVKKLNQLHYHVIIGDLPGQGTTNGPRGHVKSFQDYIHVVKGWLEEARKYKLPIIMFGHSMGGLISIHSLMTFQKKELPDVLILSSPCLGLANDPPLSKRAAAQVLNFIYPSLRFPSGVKPGSGTRDEEMRTRDAADGLLIKRVSVRWYKELVRSIDRAHHQTDMFPNIPLLVTQGGEDLIVNKNSVKKWFNQLNITNKYYKEWDGLYHEVINEPERDQVLAHLLGFVTIQLATAK